MKFLRFEMIESILYNDKRGILFYYLYHYDFQLSVNITFASLFLLFLFPDSRLEKTKEATNDDSAY